MTSSDDLFALALQAHRAGDFARAESLYRRVLQANACHAGVWNLLGVLAGQMGHPLQALEYLEKAVALRSGEPGFRLNLGNALQVLGRLPDAAASFQEALRLQPSFAEAHNNLANILSSLGKRSEALDHWRRALELRPDYPEAHGNFAQTLLDEGQAEEALVHAHRALELRPDLASAHSTAGRALAAQEDWDGAASCFREALRHRPDWAEAHCSLGHVLNKQNKLVEAADHLGLALALQPGLALAHNELGTVRAKEGRDEEAVRHFRQALGLDPNNAEAHHNLALVLKLRRQFDLADFHLARALTLQPTFVEAAVQRGQVLRHQGRLDEALDCVRQALAAVPADAALYTALGQVFSDRGQLVESQAALHEALRLKPDLASAHSCLLIVRAHDPNVGTDVLFEEHRQWATAHARVPLLWPAAGHNRDPERRLRVGYVSGDLQGHVVAGFLEPVLVHHDPDRIETLCYSDVAVADTRTNRFRTLAQHWQPIWGRDDDEVAELVRSDAVDILVDLGGHTGTRLGVFARKPAPVQITYLGYPHTTGLDVIDYRLTDAVADPPGEPRYHTEELLRLPGGFCCYLPPSDAPEVGPLPARLTGGLTFGALHKLAKLNGRVLDLWCDLLRAVPIARLLLFRDGLRGSVEEAFRREFAHRGFDESRVMLRHAVAPGQNYLSIYREVDVALDTFPWCGHATACEGLWMGVPILSLAGERHAGRMVASVLMQLGLTEWVARTPGEFVDKAASWAGQPEQLADLRAGLRERMRGSLLCDGRGFTGRLEEAYRAVWRRWVESRDGPGAR